MDGSSSTNDTPPERDALLYYDGHAYRLLATDSAIAGCFQPLKLGSREIVREFFESIARDLAMRERLRLEVSRWAAYFGEGIGYDFLAWLTEQVFTGRLGLYQVVCSGPPRGEPKPLDEKKVRAAISAAADNTPWVAPIKSGLQAMTGADLITDEPVSRLGAVAGIALGVVSSGKLIAKGMKKISEKLGEKGLAQAQQRAGATTDPRFVKRYKGPDGMTKDNGKLTEREGKGAQDGNTRVATDKLENKQGSAKKNKAYAEKMLRQKKKVGKPSNRIGGPYTTQEMELWQEVSLRSMANDHTTLGTGSRRR
ncbi:MAG: hypothetical protein HY273_07990 [Gammaproteobacteria bacterium]|nr:hypothetical protein [Gammaproteobacteria bacterium]